MRRLHILVNGNHSLGTRNPASLAAHGIFRRQAPMDGAAFRVWAKPVHKTSETLYEDAMIAATAQVNHLVLAARNGADFKSFDIGLLNPFDVVQISNEPVSGLSAGAKGQYQV